MSREILVPAGLLSVFEVINSVGRSGLWLYAVEFDAARGPSVCREFHCAFRIENGGGVPAHIVFVISRPVGRGYAVVVVGAVVHYRPVARCSALFVVGSVIGVVVVGKSEHMSELVAECADAVPVVQFVVQLGAAGVAVQSLAIEFDIQLCAVLYEPLVGPYSARLVRVGFAYTCIYYIDKIYFAVVVSVVQREVNLAVQCLAGFHNHFLGVCVLFSCGPVTVVHLYVLAVVRCLLCEGDRAEHVKLRVVLSARLLNEVVFHRPRSAPVVVALQVEHVVHCAQGVAGLVLGVREVHQYEQPSRGEVHRAHLRHAARTLLIARVGTARLHFGVGLHFAGADIVSVRVLDHEISVQVRHEVIVLISVQDVLNRGSVRLPVGSHTGLGRHSHDAQRHKACTQKSNCFFHDCYVF